MSFSLIPDSKGGFEAYDNAYDVVIHCRNEQKQRRAEKRLEVANRMIWHDAKTDPPGEDDGDCFIVHTKKGDLVMEAQYSRDPEKIESGRCWTAGWGSVIHVTDWMPMPEPPEKKSQHEEGSHEETAGD